MSYVSAQLSSPSKSIRLLARQLIEIDPLRSSVEEEDPFHRTEKMTPELFYRYYDLTIGLQSLDTMAQIIMPNRMERTIDAREAVGVNVLPEGLEIVGDAVMNPESFQAPLLSKTEDQKIIRFEDIVLVEEARDRNVPVLLHCDDDHLDYMQVHLWFREPAFQDKIMNAVKKNVFVIISLWSSSSFFAFFIVADKRGGHPTQNKHIRSIKNSETTGAVTHQIQTQIKVRD